MAKNPKRVGNRNPKEVKPIDYREVNKARQEITAAARELAIKCREKSPYSVEKQGIFIDRLAKYIEEQRENGEPLTVSGFTLAAQIPQRTWEKMRHGEYDTMIYEYKMLHGIDEDAIEAVNDDGEVVSLLPWSEIVDKCYLLAQEERERGCITGKAGNVVGNIFLLKAQHGLNDQPDQIAHQTNVQIVADAETALKALEMCK